MAAASVLSHVAIVFVGGDEYADIQSRLWLFAVLGTLLSMIQLLVYALLAREGTHTVWVLWVALAAIVLVGQLTDTVTQLVVTVTAVDAVLFLALLAPVLLRADRAVGAGPP